MGFFNFQSIEWRKKSCIDDIESWDPPEVLKKYFVGGHIGYDKEGSPVWIDLAANLDWRGKCKWRIQNFPERVSQMGR